MNKKERMDKTGPAGSVAAQTDNPAEKQLHEINRYKDASFPVGMYVVTRERIIPEGRGYMDLHWHAELQMNLVTSGTMRIQVNGVEYTLEKGQGIFINRNFLHITTGLTGDGEYVSFNFPERMLGFFSGSRMEQDDVLPFTSRYAFSAVVLNREIPWQAEVLGQLWKLRDLFLDELWKGKKGHAEYHVSLIITGIWYQLITHIEDEISALSKAGVRKQERIQTMLSFIHENYMNPIKLKAIADAASVSEGECCRCFQEMVRKSPNQYLLSYRVARAMELLDTTEKSVTEIAAETGFSDASHFIQYFRRQNGITPKEYRNKKC